MFARSVTMDEEQQTSSEAAGHNEMQVERNKKMPKTKDIPPKQSLFLCLHGRDQMKYGIRIRCHRPPLVMRFVESKQGGDTDLLYPSPDLVRNGFYEKDSVIYTKLVTACFQFHGGWTRWVPYYGIATVQETQVMMTSHGLSSFLI